MEVNARKYDNHPDEHPIGIQIFGSEPCSWPEWQKISETSAID